MYSYNLLFSRAFASPYHFFLFLSIWRTKKGYLIILVCVSLCVYLFTFPLLESTFSIYCSFFFLLSCLSFLICLLEHLVLEIWISVLCVLPMFSFSLPFVFVPCLWHFFHAQILSFYLVESVILYLMEPRFPVLPKSPTPKFIWIFSHILSALLL